MSQVYALIPARIGSKGIERKNFRELGGTPLYLHAVDCALAAGCLPVISTDGQAEMASMPTTAIRLYATGRLHADDCPMIDIVCDALARVPGDPSDVWCLLQPSSPLRTPAHVRAAIALLQETQADSVVSLVALPPTHHPQVVMHITGGGFVRAAWGFRHLPTRRQDLEPAYIRDGTVYAFRRSTVTRHGNIYGQDVRPLIIPPEETCELDTEADWAALEQRWQARG